MKILRVQMENLNSLRGKHVIDFTDPVFASGLFAITGPTGAGKSTVLDAICLALFHRTPRQDNVSHGQNELMSTGTGNCSAEVEFLTGGKSYRATWTQRRARQLTDGALQPPRASLSDLQGNLVSERVGDTKSAIAGVLGLSFEQFSRSVLLAQGGFDAFLKARDNERAELLERLTGTEVYGEISKAVFERTRAEEEVVKLLRGQQGNIALMTDEDLDATREALQQAQKAYAVADTQRQSFDVAVQWLNTLERLTVAVDKAIYDLAEIGQETEAAASYLHLLTQGERAEPFRSYSQAFVRTEAHQDACRKKLESLGRERAQTEELRKTATWQTLASALAVLRSSQAGLDRHQTAVREVSGAIAKLGVDGNLGECLVNWRQLDKAASLCVSQRDEERNKETAAVAGVKTSEDRIAAARGHVRQKLAEKNQAATAFDAAQRQVEALLDGKTRDEMLEQIYLLHARNESLEALRPLYSRRVRAVDQQAKTVGKLKDAKAAAPVWKATTDRIQAELEAAKEVRATLAEALDNARHIRSLAEERDRLEPGEECPLCGSAEHPAIETYKAVDPERFERQWQTQDLLVDRLSRQVEQARGEHSRCQERITVAQEELASQAEDVRAVQEEWSVACLALQVSPENEEQLQALVETARATYVEAEQLRQLIGAQEDVVGTTRLASDAATTAHRDALQQMGLREEAGRAAVQAQSEAHARVERAALRAESAREELRGALPGGGFPIDVAEWLAEQDGVWARYKELLSQQTLMQEQLPSLQHDVAKATDIARQWRQAWDRGEWDEPAQIEVPADCFATLASEVDSHGAALMRVDGQLKESKIQTDEAEAAFRLAQQEWCAAVESSGFQSPEDLVAALLAPDELTRLRDLRESLISRRVQAQAVQFERSTQLQAHKEDPKADRPREEVEGELERLTAEARSLQEQVISYSTRLNTDSEHRQTWAALLGQIATAHRVLDDWQHLNGLVGSASGQVFRRFAQGLTLDRLVYLANRHLRNLDGGHFTISRSLSDLGLMVEDAWDAGARRDASTLSGGETFLVSLALALGLSDLVSQNIQIESFFLDEGFGTLDPDALAQAMDTIESLNASGKLIGVISHIDAVKDRIPVQIKVVPTARLGSSRLELPSLV